MVMKPGMVNLIRLYLSVCLQNNYHLQCLLYIRYCHIGLQGDVGEGDTRPAMLYKRIILNQLSGHVLLFFLIPHGTPMIHNSPCNHVDYKGGLPHVDMRSGGG